ncbi:MAG: NADPH:quinone reductase [Candidatus Bathyarchaeia archaeon]
MKAIRVHEFGSPDVMHVEEIPDPTPGPGQILMQIKAIGVNPTDTYTRSGAGAKKVSLPYTPGIDAAGVVESIGESVTSLAVGARVYTSGTITGAYAERALCTESQLHPLPANISYAQGAAINIPYATAYRALFQRANALPGEVALVHGASGGVGIAAVQIARSSGMRVIGTASTTKGRELVLKEGAHQILDHSKPDYLDQLLALTNGRGVDIVLEMLANVNLAKDLRILAMGGRVVVIGSRGKIEIDPREAMLRDATILGMLLFNVSDRQAAGIHAALFAGLENGSLRPVVGKEMSLSEASRAHREIMEPGAYGKIVLIP